MTAEEYWERFDNEDLDKSVFFEETCAFFSKKLSQEDLEDYDFMDIVIDVIENRLLQKDYPSVLKLRDIIKENNKYFYEKEFNYLDDKLIDYYTYLQDEEKVRQAFSTFVKYPVKNYDHYLSFFKILTLWQCFNVVDEAFEQNYHAVRDSNKLLQNAEYELVEYYFSAINSNHYQKKSLDKAELYAALEKIDFEFSDETVPFFELGYLSKDYDLELLKQEWDKKTIGFEILLKGYFSRYMYEKGMDFRLSGFLMSLIQDFTFLGRKTSKVNPCIF